MRLNHSRPLTLGTDNLTNRKRLVYREVVNDFFKRTGPPKLNPNQSKNNQTLKLETKIDPISLSKELADAITKARGNPQNLHRPRKIRLRQTNQRTR